MSGSGSGKRVSGTSDVTPSSCHIGQPGYPVPQAGAAELGQCEGRNAFRVAEPRDCRLRDVDTLSGEVGFEANRVDTAASVIDRPARSQSASGGAVRGGGHLLCRTHDLGVKGVDRGGAAGDRHEPDVHHRWCPPVR